MSAPPLTRKRYYGDDGKIHPDLSNRDFMVVLHAAYTHWVQSNYHLRDFAQAAHHVAICALGTYRLDGGPELTGDRLQAPALPLAKPSKAYRSQPAVRLYDEINALSPEVNLKHLETAVHYAFVNWVADGFHERDFAQYLHDCCETLVYDHQITQGLGGLGGCRTEQQFLTEPYR
jgi:hypothetical protein